jgi:predicted oxidoreductase
MAWSPTGGGRLFNKGNETGNRLREAAAALSAKHGGATVDQLCYAWILSHPAGPVVVSGTNKIDRLRSLAGGDELILGREDWFTLVQAAQGRRIP